VIDVLNPQTTPSIVVVLLWLALMILVRRTGYLIALLSIGATWLHECCHLACGVLLGAKPISFSLWPRREGDKWVLGSVGFSNLNVCNSAFVAFAPLGMIFIGYGIFQYWMIPAFTAADYVIWVVAGYGVACSFYACLPSTTDLKVGALSALMYALVGYGLWRLSR